MATPRSDVTTPPSSSHLDDELVTTVGRRLVDQVASVLLGKDATVEVAVAAILAGGHVLVEDVPGVGKTLLAKALARSIGGSFGRIQGTADLLPTDVTGVTVYDTGSGVWEFRPGPIFANVVVVDEINRATPRAQSALLEAMAEHQVTVDGTSHRLPDPHVVVATQNPYGDVGTFPLGDGQRDRFTIAVELGLPGHDAELDLLAGRGGEPRLAQVAPVVSLADVHQAIAGVAASHATGPLASYVLALVDGLRHAGGVRLGPSPRAALALVRVARGLSALAGRTYLTPDDVQRAAVPVLAHRLGLERGASMADQRAVVEAVVSAVPVPV